VPSSYSAGSASVQVVPDFSGAQKAIGKWFASQGNLKVPVDYDVDRSSLVRATAAVESTRPKLKIDIDRDHLLKSLDFLTGFSTVQGAVEKIFSPKTIGLTSLGGAATALAATISQAAGAIALLPAAASAAIVPISALVVGMQGLGDAFKNAGDPEKFAEALKELSPAARDFVVQTHQLAGAWKELRLDVQEHLFASLGDSIKALGVNGIPILRKGLVGMADELNTMFKGIFDAIDNPARLADIGGIFDNLKATFHEIALAAGPFVDALIQITKVGSDFLPGLVAGFGDLAKRFDEFISHARETGQLQQFLSNALSVIGDLLTVVGNLGSSLMSIFRAAAPAGQILLDVIKGITGNLAAFLKTDVAQSGLSEFFLNITQAISALTPAFDALTRVLVTSILPAMSGFAAAVAPIANDLLVQFADMLGELAPLFYPALAEAVGTALSALTPLVGVFSEIAQTLLPPLIDLIGRVAPLFAQLAETIGDALVGAVHALEPALGPISDALVAIGEALVSFVRGASDLASGILPPLVVVLEALAKALEFIAPALPAIVTGFLAFKAMSFLSGVFKGIADGFLNMAINLENIVGKNMLGSVVNGMTNAAGAASGLAGALGSGGLGLAIAVITAGVVAFTSAFAQHRAEVQQATTEITTWYQAIASGGQGADEAWGKLIGKQKELSDAEAELIKMQDHIPEQYQQMEGGSQGWELAIGRQATKVSELKGELKDAFDALTPLEQAEFKVAAAIHDHGVNSLQANEAIAAYNQLSFEQKQAQDEIAAATQTATDRINAQRDAIEQSANADIAYERAQLAVTQAQTSYTEAVKQYGAESVQAQQAQLNLQDATLRAAEAAAKKAEADNAGKSQAEITKAAHDAYMNTLIQLSATMTGPAKAAIDQLIGNLQDTDTQVGITHDGVVNLGTVVEGLPPGHYIGISANDQEMIGRLRDLGVKVNELPDGSFAINLDDTGARLRLNTLLSDYGGKPIPVLRNDRGQIVGNAQGGPLEGPGTGHSDSFLSWVSNGEWVIREDASSKYGPAKMAAINLGIADVRLPGFAAGGPANYGTMVGALDQIQFPTTVQKTTWNAVIQDEAAWLALMAAKSLISLIAPSAGASGPVAQIVQSIASGYGWGSGAEWNALSQIISHESGWNPNAQNPTSTAYGLFQFLNSTWAGTGIAKTSDPALQTRAGLTYIRNRYTDPIGAWNFWQAHHWYGQGGPVGYDSGGWLPPGLSTVFNGTGRPEPVLTAREHDALMRWRTYERSRQDGRSWMGDVHIYAQQDKAREIVDELWHKIRVASRGGVYSSSATVFMAG
jgi:hypothetical protein